MSKKPGKKKSGRKPKSLGRSEQVVTSEAALQFIRRMQKAFPKAPRTRSEKERLREYIGKFSDRLLKAVGRRVQSDIMMRAPETIRRQDFPKSRPSRTAARKNKKKR
jgi:hypothetical protein